MSSKIFTLIPKIMDEVGAITKDRTNTQGSGYKFRGIDDVYNALQSPLVKYGVFFTPSVLENNREERTSKSGGNLIYTVMRVKYTFYADDGSSFEVVTVGEAMDSGDKSANKAMSAALKYALLQVFCVPTEEDNDTENQSHEVNPVAPIRPASRPAAQQAAPSSRPAVQPAVKIAPVGRNARTLLGAEIMTAAKAINCGENEMADWCVSLYGKPMTGMSLDEMQNFLTVLKAEMRA